MDNRATRAIMGICIASVMGGCSTSAGDDDSGPRQAGGGLDGGGLIGVGLSWSEGVFVQPIWDEEQLRLLVTNRRSAAVAFAVHEVEWPADDEDELADDQPPTRGDALVQETVPARSTASIDGSALLGPTPDLLWVAAGDDLLGLIERPRPPLVTGILPVVSNETRSSSQMETGFALLPGPSFQVTVTLTRPGELRLKPATSPSADVELLSATDASSDDGSVTATTDGFHVVVPADTSAEHPARVELSYSLPLGSMTAGKLVAFDAGFFCFEPSVSAEGCGSGASLLRFVPAP